jgi:hypothetical protein
MDQIQTFTTDDVLGSISEHLIPREEQVLLGQFYTPRPVADLPAASHCTLFELKSELVRSPTQYKPFPFLLCPQGIVVVDCHPEPEFRSGDRRAR